MAEPRPTRHRLFIAMGVASILFTALLAVDVDLRTFTLANPADSLLELTVDIRDPAPPRIPSSDEDSPLVELEPIAISESKRDGSLASDVYTEVAPEPVRDWQRLAAISAKESVDDYYRQEDVRAAMWRQTYSTMFEGEDQFASLVETPILDDFEFRQPVGVLGLGFTIGSCFFGVPLAGIPVEDRTAVITVFYCKG